MYLPCSASFDLIILSNHHNWRNRTFENADSLHSEFPIFYLKPADIYYTAYLVHAIFKLICLGNSNADFAEPQMVHFLLTVLCNYIPNVNPRGIEGSYF